MSKIAMKGVRSEHVIVDERWQELDLPPAIKQFIIEWTKRFLSEIDGWPYLYYSHSVAITFAFNGKGYEIKPQTFGLPVDAQAIMEEHAREMSDELEMVGCTTIMCFGEID